MWNRLCCLVAVAACGANPASAPKLPPAAEPATRAGLTLDQIASGAVVLPNLGSHHRAITTASAQAQALFDQGLRLIYGFNHDEAARSFARAAQIDPTCASCFWGVALALGPNYNVPMLDDRFPAAWQALEQARRLSPATTPVEQALIAALAKRYPGPQPKDPGAMQPFNQAYADAMTSVARQFRADLDVQVLRAESLMDLNPWKLWSASGEPAPGTQEIVATLEAVLAIDPQHPGANHYYIHAVEASLHPDKAVPSADRLTSLIPDAGHIVHMPAHIYQRVGRYADASEANRHAVKVDLDYQRKAPSWGYYGMYLVHNYGFLAYSASMEGRSHESLEAARASADNFPPAMLAMMPGMDFFIAEPLLVMVRFGMFDQILATPRPDARYATLTALWLHAHGVALAATGKLADAAADLAALTTLAQAIPADLTADTNSTRDLLAVAIPFLDAVILQQQRDPRAIEVWTTAVAAEDRLSYSEPADWFFPVRHYLGAALLTANRWTDAEQVYRDDLARNPGNGWGLYGLARALRGQHRVKDAEATEQSFAKAWSHADIELSTTALL